MDHSSFTAHLGKSHLFVIVYDMRHSTVPLGTRSPVYSATNAPLGSVYPRNGAPVCLPKPLEPLPRATIMFSSRLFRIFTAALASFSLVEYAVALDESAHHTRDPGSSIAPRVDHDVDESCRSRQLSGLRPP